MPLKSETALSYIGIDPAKYEDEDSFKADFDKTWIKTELAEKDPSIRGRALAGMNGKLRSRAKKAAKELEIELDVTDDTDVAEFLETLPSLVAKKNKAIVDGYEEKLKGAGNDKAAKEWEAKYGELHKKFEETSGLLKQSGEKYTELETSVKAKAWNDRKEAYWQEAFGKVKFKSGIDDLTKGGFDTKMRGEYQVLPDEDGNPYTADKEGKRIADKKKAQTFRDLSDLLPERAKEFRIDQSNPSGGKPVDRTIANNGNGEGGKDPNGQPINPVRTIHPGALAAMGR